MVKKQPECVYVVLFGAVLEHCKRKEQCVSIQLDSIIKR